MRTIVEFDPRCQFDLGDVRNDPTQRGLAGQATRALIERIGKHQGKPPAADKSLMGRPRASNGVMAIGPSATRFTKKTG